MFDNQKRTFDKLEAAARRTEAAIAAIDANLKPEVVRDRIAGERMAFLTEVGKYRDDLHARRSYAESELPYWTQDAARRRAKFSRDAATDSAVSLATFQKLRETPSAELIEYTRDAVRDGEVAAVEAARLVLFSRLEGDPSQVACIFRDKMRDLVKQLPVDENSVSQTKDCERTISLCDLAEVMIIEVARGKPDPVGRINATRGLSPDLDLTALSLELSGQKAEPLSPVDKMNAARGIKTNV